MKRSSAVWLVRVAGGVVFVLFVVLQVVNPKRPVVRNTPRFRDPVAAFELARTPGDVLGILGGAGAPERTETVRRMKLGTRIDFLFLLAYPAFYLGIAAVLIGRGGVPPVVRALLVVLPCLMALGDAVENVQLLGLADTLDPAAMAPLLARLRVFTLLKWYAVFGASGVVGVLLWRETQWWRWSAPLFVLGGAVGFLSILHPPAIEWTVPPLAVAWTMAWIWALRAPTAAGA